MDYSRLSDVPESLRASLAFVAEVTKPGCPALGYFCDSYFFQPDGSSRLVGVLSYPSQLYRRDDAAPVLELVKITGVCWSTAEFMDFNPAFAVAVRPLDHNERAQLK